jgi:mono/diheme cytochrome c family protein
MSSKSLVQYSVVILLLTATFFNCNDHYSQGKRIYISLCSNCHGEDGSGLKLLIPALNKNDFLKSTDSLVCIIRNGVNADSLDSKLSVMPSHKKITAVEMTNLINYVQKEFLENKIYTPINKVEEYLKKCN